MFQRPTREIFQNYLISLSTVLVLFAVIYGGTNYWGSHRPNPYQLWHSLELSIPFIPEFILIYLSIFFLGLVPLFCLCSSETRRLSRAIIFSTFMAGVIFILLPAPAGYARPLEIPGYQILFSWLYSVDNVANTFPSLHVAISYLVVRAIHSRHSQAKYLWVWFALICLSVLFTHQHHLLDIVGGWLLGELTFRKIYCKSPRLVYEPAS